MRRKGSLIALTAAMSIAVVASMTAVAAVNSQITESTQSQETKPETQPETKPETQPETKPETQPETKPETQPETQPETKPETQPETQPETKPETQPETQPETKPETQPETQVNKNVTVDGHYISGADIAAVIVGDKMNPVWESNQIVNNDDEYPVFLLENYAYLDNDILKAFNADSYYTSKGYADDVTLSLGTYSAVVGGTLHKTGKVVSPVSILFAINLIEENTVYINDTVTVPNKYFNGKTFTVKLDLPECVTTKTVTVKHDGKTQKCNVEAGAECNYIVFKTSSLTNKSFYNDGKEVVATPSMISNKSDLFEIILDKPLNKPSTGGSSSGGGFGSGSVAGHGYGGGAAAGSSSPKAESSNKLMITSGSKNAAGQQVIGNTTVFILDDKNAAVAGLPAQTVNQINAINTGKKLADTVKDIDLKEYTVLTGTNAFIMNDNNGKVKTAITPVTLNISELKAGLNGVNVLFYNNATGRWELITPTAVDFNKKTITVNLPGSGTLSVVYKK